MSPPADRYTHGHHASVVGAHATRTIANSAAYLEPYLGAGRTLLDVGCGPGSITAEFAERLSAANVLGVDLSDDVIADARTRYPDVRFEAMDLYRLDVADDTFDIVHAHQVLQHVSDPIAALVEMRRVAKPSGLVAVRDADYAAMHWAPEAPALDRWLEIYRQVARHNDAEPDAARHLVSWAAAAGFADITPSIGTWLFTTGPSAQWWAETWSQRVVSSSLADQAVEAGFSTVDELAEISASWKAWAEHPDAWFVVVNGQLLCRT